MTTIGRVVTTVIVLLVIGAGIYFLASRTDEPLDDIDNEPIDTPVEGLVIAAEHTFANGEHRISGVIPLPTPCHSLEVAATIAKSLPEQVWLEFTSTSGTSDVCAQVIDDRDFELSFQASEAAVIRARWNGQVVNLNLNSAAVSPVEEFSARLRAKVITELGQPIEGFEPMMFLEVYPGLTESDFDGVAALIGGYEYVNGELTYDLKGEQELHSAARAISDEGMTDLLENLARRLGVALSDEDAIEQILTRLN